MSNEQQFQNQIHRPPAATAALVLAIVFALTFVLTLSAEAQTFTVIHNFTLDDGAYPLTGLTMDVAGNLYGTTARGGHGYGTVFELKHSGNGWLLNTLYNFAGVRNSDGGFPYGRVTIALDGTLYGTTEEGGNDNGCYNNGCGTVFRLRPAPAAPKSAQVPWDEAVLYHFAGYSDGYFPAGDLTFDQSKNLYGTAFAGGSHDLGVIYELTPSGGGWTKTILYSAKGGNHDGARPQAGVVFDGSSNLYGVFSCNSIYGEGYGAVYQLSRSGSGWTERIIHEFTGGIDGGNPFGGLILDSSGNLYGTTSLGGGGGGGTVFELTPFNGNWSFNTLYAFPGCGQCGPSDKLSMDSAGSLYGTTIQDGAYGLGSVFKLTPSNDGWNYTSLHDFCAGGYPCSDGSRPVSNLVFDAMGNLYGTTKNGGSLECTDGCGVVFKITP